MNIPNDTLSQWFEKDHLDLKNELSQKEWELFLDQYNDTFIDETSELAERLFNEFKINYIRRLEKTKQIYKNVILAMQDAEELEGLEDPQDYLKLMEDIRHEAQKRFNNCVDTMGGR
jgi:hypothetical protein